MDRCGRILNSILKESPEWIVKSATTQSGSVANVVTGVEAGFNNEGCNLSLQIPSNTDEGLISENVSEFAMASDFISRLVMAELELDTFTRIGFRAFFMVPFNEKDGKESGKKWTSSLEMFQISPVIASTTRLDIVHADFGVTYRAGDLFIRAGVHQIERNADLNLGDEILRVRVSNLDPSMRSLALREQQAARKRMDLNQKFGVQADIDVYADNPKQIDAESFIDIAWQTVRETSAIVFAKRKD